MFQFRKCLIFMGTSLAIDMDYVNVSLLLLVKGVTRFLLITYDMQ